MIEIESEAREPDDVLLRATEAMGEQGRACELPAEVVERTLAALELRRGERRWDGRTFLDRILTIKTMKRSAWVASLAAMVLVVVTLITMHLGARNALAQVMERVREVKSVRYQATMIVPHGKDSRQASSIAATVTVVDPAWMSIEMAPTPMISGMTMICDLKDGKAFSLIPNAKMAVRMNRQNQPKELEQINILEKLRSIGQKQADYLGEEEIGGHRAREYQVQKKEDSGGEDTKIWIDVQTHLPVRMEIEGQMGNGAKFQYVWSNFQWDVSVDGALLNMEIPQDYEVADMPASAGGAGEEDLLSSLRYTAQRHGGQSADIFNVRDSIESLEAGNAELIKLDGKAREVVMEQMVQVMRGLEVVLVAL